MKRLISFALCIALGLPVFGTGKASAQDIFVCAKGAVVMEYHTGKVLYDKNCKDRLPMASTTKIMSALLTAESGGLDERFTVDSEAIKVEGSSMGLQKGDTVTKRILMYGMLLPSGNDAANAAAVAVAGSVTNFVQLMNDRAKAIGMRDTHFVTSSGLDDDTDEHYSTAYDMALLAREAIDNGIFREICGTARAKVCFGDPPYDRWLVNTNKLLTSCDGVIGVKTGFTDKAGRCLVSACERNGTTLICVTLNDRSDWADHKALYDRCFGLCESVSLQTDDLSVNVVGGESESVGCYSPEVKINLPIGEGDSVTRRVLIKPFVYAPTPQKEQVGCVRYYYGGRLIAESPVLTKLSVTAQSGANTSVAEYYFEKIKGIIAG
ncbi:MAG: D-alanyl-D-alanine carboxypeptidase [Ruminococcus sp.]|nr:D-alanyl-D-alanine carboxypeptidase [Ruminococcus sp.]